MATIPMTASTTRRKRQRVNRRTNGWTAKWSDELKIKEGETAWIALCPGDYPAEDGDRTAWLGLPLFKVQYTNRWGNTSWGYFQGQRDSNNCTLRARADCGDSRVTEARRGEPNRFFMNVMHLDTFRRTQVTDKDGLPLRYRHGKLKGQIVHRWEAVKSLREKKDIAKSGDFEDMCFYRRKFMELPGTHFEALKQIARIAKSMCVCGGQLIPAVYECHECGEILLDVEDTDLSEAEVQRFGDNSVRCNNCGHTGFPQAQQICDSCEDPEEISPWAVAAQITKVREGQWPALRVLKVIPLTEWEFPDGARPAESDEDGNLVLEEEFKKKADSQFDLEAYTAPKENSYYSDLLELREGDIGFASDTKDYGRFR